MISSIVVKPEAPPPSPEETSSNDFEPFQIVKQSKVRLPEKVCEPKPHPVMWKAPPFHPRKESVFHPNRPLFASTANTPQRLHHQLPL